MEFQKTGQQGSSDSKRSKMNGEVGQTLDSLPVYKEDQDNDQNATGSLSSSYLRAIDLHALRIIAANNYNQRKWSDDENQKIEELLDKVDEELHNFRLKEAETPILKILQIASALGVETEEFVWEICDVLAKLYERLEEHEKSLSVLTQSLSLKVKRLGEKDPKYIVTLVEYANCLAELGKTEEANKIYKEARELKAETE